MALGKYSRIDGRKSSTNYCSTVTFVGFVGLCLVGVWMMTSSSVVPVQNVDETSQDNKDMMQTQVKETSDSTESNPGSESSTNNESKTGTESSTSSESSTNSESNTSNNESHPKQFEDNPGDLPEDATKGDSNVNETVDEKSSSLTEKPTEQPAEGKQEKMPGKLSGEEDTNREKSTTFDDKYSSLTEQPADGTQEKMPGTLSRKEDTNTEKNATTDEKSSSLTEKPTEQPAEGKQEKLPEKFSGEEDTNREKSTTVDDKYSSLTEKTTEQQPADGNQEKMPGKHSIQEETNTENDENKREKKESKTDDYIDSKAREIQTETGENKSGVGIEKSGANETKTEVTDSNSGVQGNLQENSQTNISNSVEAEKRSDISSEPKDSAKTENKVEENKSEETAGEKKEMFPSGAQSELLNETMTEGGEWKTQAVESKKEADKSSEPEKKAGYSWKLCNVTAGTDYIPCLDNIQAIKHLQTTKHYEHRERHCPDDPPTCLVPVPEGYQRPIEWPTSREKIWYHNVPHTKLAEIKGHQNWVKVSGEYLTFPGGGTQFKHGALHYIDFIQQVAPVVAWGNRSRVILDVGCGVASFGGFLFDRDVLTMSFAPKDEHEAQVQFALERGIPALSAVMGTKRLPFPGRVFDIVHCARCRVPWHIEGGMLLLELNRLLRPGGFFVWSATPIYQKLPEDVEIWEAMKKLTKAMCWEVVSISKDRVNGVGVAVYQKPSSNECYESRSVKEPPLCKESDDPNAAWNVPLQACMHKIPVDESERGSKWPEPWPARVEKPPYWLLSSQVGVYGKTAPEDFKADYEHWKRVVTKSYLTGMGFNWSSVRNVMDMRAIYGGFAAALREMNVWVMNVVNIDSPDTLPIIYERGLFGMYHNWCESLNTYPRSYDLLHADHLFSKIKKKCNFEALVVEVDRILRPEGKLIVRDKVEIISELEIMFKSMQWEVRLNYSKNKEGILCMQKSRWRPKETITLTYAIE